MGVLEAKRHDLSFRPKMEREGFHNLRSTKKLRKNDGNEMKHLKVK